MSTLNPIQVNAEVAVTDGLNAEVGGLDRSIPAGVATERLLVFGVEGVKGNAENEYRTGLVNLTPEQIGVRKQTIIVDGHDFPLNSWYKTTIEGIEGVVMWYDDGSLDGKTIFIPDAVGIQYVAQQLHGMMETFTLSIDGNVLTLTGSLGTTSSVTLPI